MKESYWGYWLIMLGIFIMVVMIFTQSATTTTTQDYYQLKEVANSAMADSIDYSYYSQTEQIRMMKEVFVENFVRRFAETISMTNTYRIDFFDLYEAPPKASIKISTNTGSYMIANTQSDFDVVNSIDIIVEYTDACSNEENTDRECEGRPGLDRYEYSACKYYTESD